MTDEIANNGPIELGGQEAIDLWLNGEDGWNQWTDEHKHANVSFIDVDFGALRSDHNLDHISFRGYRFPKKGKANFLRAKFGEGDVDFMSAEFGEGNVSFNGAKFGEGDVSFNGAKFGEGDVSFIGIHKGLGIFSFTPSQLQLCKNLEMSESTIDAILVINGINSPVPLDLTHTKLAYPIDMDEVTMNYRWAYTWFDFKYSLKPDDSSSFRRLKQLALEAGDHERVLDYFSKEIRTSYWHSIKGFKLTLYYLYDWVSDYGRSIVRPLIGLGVIASLYARVYSSYIEGLLQSFNKEAVIDAGWKYSLGHTFPLFPALRNSGQLEMESLLGTGFKVPIWLSFVTVSQLILSTIFLFLLALALRNRFRI